MKNLIITIFLFVCCIYLISGCSIATMLEFYNNTSSDMKLIIDESTTCQVKKGQKILILFPSYTKKFTIQIDKYMYEYPVVIPEKFIISPWFSSKRVYFQIESDGKIYVLKNGDFPAKTFPAQPTGYPLIPDNPKVKNNIKK